MLKKRNRWPNSTIFIILSAAFFLFYLAQIPSHTSNADVLVYSCKASSESPILTYAFLDHRYRELMALEPLPNYHLFHTVILWAAYRAFPQELRESIWPAGLVSSLSGALAVGVTFLIWTQLGIRREVAIITSIVAGFIPGIFYSSLIGEVHALQLCMTLFFIYFFIRCNVIGAIWFFLIANLVTPIAGLSASGAFLKCRDKETLVRMVIVGAAALACYFTVYWLIGSQILKIFGEDVGSTGDNSLLWKLLKLFEIIILNINFFLPFLVLGCFIVWKEERVLFYGLFIGLAPHILMSLFFGSAFIMTGHVALLFVFWILSLPVGMALWRFRYKFYVIPLFVVTSVFLTYGLFITPGERDGTERYEVGKELREESADYMKIIGHWAPSIGVTLGKYGWNYDKLQHNYVELGTPDEERLIKSNEDTAIVVEYIRGRGRVELSHLYRRLLGKGEKGGNAKDSLADFKESLLTVLYQSEFMRVYKWERNISEISQEPKLADG